MHTMQRIVTVIAATAAGAALATPSALAGDNGKSADGCSNPYTLATYDDTGQLYVDGVAEPRTQQLIADGLLSQDDLVALLASIDHNANNQLCFKVPSGWDEPSNGANRDDFVNLVDDKIVS